MEYIGSPNLGPTLGSDPESLESRYLEGGKEAGGQLVDQRTSAPSRYTPEN